MTTSTKIDVIVIGAGISGLTTAMSLAEAEFNVRVIAKEPPLRSTSAAAGANWGPYMADDERLLRWSDLTRTALEAIAIDEPDAGVQLVHGLEAETYSVETPLWAPGLPDFAVCAESDLPAGYVVGWWFTAPVVDMPRYLGYLEQRLARRNIFVELEAVSSLADLADQADLVVNCAGLGARELAGDGALVPIRGQLVIVENPGITTFFQDHSAEDPITYFMPQGDRVVLGGSAQSHSENLEVDLDLAAAIMDRCAVIEPRLRNPTVVEHRVGLRPFRPSVCLEVDWVGRQPVIHNYGHGGSGLTLSWGCAESVLSHARALVRGEAGLPIQRVGTEVVEPA